MDRKQRQMRSRCNKFEIRSENDEMRIEGYFAVFNSNYELWKGATESIAPCAFDNTVGDDVRALVDHDSRIVLGRTKTSTLELRVDNHGLWGSIKINPSDQEAVNLYERVKRGDVDQCSIGFDIINEETESRDDGSVHWTIKEVRLYEVSVVTFPAYEETCVSARKRDFDQIKKRSLDQWKHERRKKLKGGNKNGA